MFVIIEYKHEIVPIIFDSFVDNVFQSDHVWVIALPEICDFAVVGHA